jgi:hypothetical protein
MRSDGSARPEQLFPQNPNFFALLGQLDEKANGARSKSLRPIPKFLR